MNIGRRGSFPAELSGEDIGITTYRRDAPEVTEVPQNEDVMAVVASAVNAHHRHARRSRHSPNYHEENEYPKDRPPRLALPPRMDPCRPVLQLARAGTQDFGFSSVVSWDTTHPLTSNRGVELSERWVNRANSGRSLRSSDIGLLIFVERSEDEDNPRLQELRESVGNLTVPRLTLVTTEDPNSPPLYEDLPLDGVEMTPELNREEFGWLESL